jgi:transposase
MSYFLEIDERNKFEIKEDDKLARKLFMLMEGELYGRKKACKKFGFSEPRYFQLLRDYKKYGSKALIDRKRGSNKQPVRTEEKVKEIIRMRYLDPFQSAEVIAQKMNQKGMKISVRSIERTITEYGLQKKRISLASLRKKVKRI